jgi:hypothetical protein
MIHVTESQAARYGVKARGRIRHKPGEMNKLEAQYSRYLDGRKLVGEILWYRFESVNLKLADKTWLLVDFMVLMPDGMLELHEVKGTTKRTDKAGEKHAIPLIEDDAVVKMKVAAREFPFVVKLCYLTKDRGWVTKEL